MVPPSIVLVTPYIALKGKRSQAFKIPTKLPFRDFFCYAVAMAGQLQKLLVIAAMFVFPGVGFLAAPSMLDVNVYNYPYVPILIPAVILLIGVIDWVGMIHLIVK